MTQRVFSIHIHIYRAVLLFVEEPSSAIHVPDNNTLSLSYHTWEAKAHHTLSTPRNVAFEIGLPLR